MAVAGKGKAEKPAIRATKGFSWKASLRSWISAPALSQSETRLPWGPATVRPPREHTVSP
jgi:hypothetical protein